MFTRFIPMLQLRCVLTDPRGGRVELVPSVQLIDKSHDPTEDNFVEERADTFVVPGDGPRRLATIEKWAASHGLTATLERRIVRYRAEVAA